jgi:hypothetical protein
MGSRMRCYSWKRGCDQKQTREDDEIMRKGLFVGSRASKRPFPGEVLWHIKSKKAGEKTRGEGCAKSHS